MSRFRIAFESRMLPDRKANARYGQPATEAAIRAAESAMRLPLPEPLRELYADFDGLWYDETRETPPDNDTEWWEILPLSLLGSARDQLRRLYGGGTEPGYEDFEQQLARCVPFSLPEHGASFKFLTDTGGWGIRPGRVGGWSHDGGVYDLSGPLAKWLAVIGRMRSRGE